jgi:cysteine desulfurase
MIYLDYNATTPLAPEARAAMAPYFETHFGNPSSIHQAGRAARAAIDDSRDRVAQVLGAKPHEIIFTGGGTESDNLAVIGLARNRRPQGKHLVTTRTEHHAVLQAFEFLEKHEGYEVTWLGVNHEGRICLTELEAALRPDTTLVSIMSANNETGTLQPVREAAALCRSRGVLFHCDAIQSFGKEPVCTSDFDALSLASHKFHGPKGAGILYLKSGISIDSLQQGGAHENQRRPGTENVAAIVGTAKAVELAGRVSREEQQRQARLRDLLWEQIAAADPSALLNGSRKHRLSNTLNVSFPGLDGESLLMNLDLAGICASSGSACMVGSILPSHVLLAMGVPQEVARATVRFSLGKDTTHEEIVTAGARVETILRRHRQRTTGA